MQSHFVNDQGCSGTRAAQIICIIPHSAEVLWVRSTLPDRRLHRIGVHHKRWGRFPPTRASRRPAACGATLGGLCSDDHSKWITIMASTIWYFCRPAAPRCTLFRMLSGWWAASNTGFGGRTCRTKYVVEREVLQPFRLADAPYRNPRRC